MKVYVTNENNRLLRTLNDGVDLTKWINDQIARGYISSGVSTLASLTDVNLTGVQPDYVLTYDALTSKWVPKFNAPTAGNPAGTTGQVQFNNNGVFGASSNLLWDNANSRLGIGTNTPAHRLHVAGSAIVSGNMLVDASTTNNSYAIIGGNIGGWARGYRFVKIDGNFMGGLWANGDASINTLNYYTIGPVFNIGLSVQHATGAVSTGTVIPPSNSRFTSQGTSTANSTFSLLTRNNALTNTFSVGDAGLITIYKDTESSGTQSSARVEVQSSDANTNLVLTPKGNGAIIAGPAPDGTVTGGNARGESAVDLQIQKNSASQVASGTRSAILSGRWNLSSGTESVVLGGLSNNTLGFQSVVLNGDFTTAEAPLSIAHGNNTRAYLRGMFARNSSGFSIQGDAQGSEFFMRRLVSGQSQSELFVNGSTERAVLRADNRVWNASIQCTGVVSVAGDGTVVAGDALVQTFNLGIKRIGTSTSIMGNNASTQFSAGDTNMAGANFTVDADDANEALRIQFTPPTAAGTTTVTRCHCTVRLNEVGF